MENFTPLSEFLKKTTTHYHVDLIDIYTLLYLENSLNE